MKITTILCQFHIFYMKKPYKSDVNIYYNGLMRLVEDIKLLDNNW